MLRAPSTLLVVPVLTALTGCGGPSARPQPAKPVALRLAVITAERRPVERSYEVSGTVHGHSTAVLTSRVVANLREVRVRAGDRVQGGQLLILLDDSEARAAVRRAQADLAAATAARTEAEAGARASDAAARVATTNHARMARLLAAGAATQQSYDEAEARQQTAGAQRGLATAQVTGGAARIEEARAALAGAQAALTYTRIVAPFTGRVIDRRVDPGSQAAPGMPLLVVEQDGALRVEAAVDESRATSLTIGATAHVELESVGRETGGRVTEVVPAVDPSSRAFTVKVELPAAHEANLRPGMFARLRFPVGVDQRLTVPVEAVLTGGDLERLFVVEDGRARLRLVTLGQRQSGQIEVLSGLEPGEVVVAAPPPHLMDGTPLETRL